MSRHAQLSPEAQAKLAAQRRNSTITSFLVAILGIVLFLVILGLIFLAPIVREQEPIVAYSGAQSPEPPRPDTKKMQRVQSKPSSPSAAATKMIVANTASPTAIPVPDVEVTEPAIEFGAGDAFGDDWGMDGFDGMGASGGGLFGSSTGPGLTGTFYDFKQTADRKPTGMAIQDWEKGGRFDIGAAVNRSYDEELESVVRRDLDDRAFAEFFSASKQLRLTQLYIPRVYANEAPEAFKIGDEVQGRRWAIAYRGSVVPPESGRFRFVGFADDILTVLVDDQVVLDGSLAAYRRGADRRNSIQQAHTVEGWPSYVGKWIEVRGGWPIDIKILTGERPGGHYSGYLLIEKEGVNYQKDSRGAPKLPLFKMAPGKTPERGETLPELGPDTPWSMWPSKA